MAIKGKRRSRGGRSRARAIAPRPTLVVPKKPFFQRTWVRVTLVMLLILAASGLTLGVIVAQRQAAEREAAQREVTRVGDEIRDVLEPVAQVAGGSILVLPELQATIGAIQAGEVRPRQVERRVQRWEDDLRGAANALTAIETDNRDLRRSIERIADGLELYVVLVQGVPSLTELERARQIEQAVLELQPEFQAAAGTVQSGYLIYLNERVDVGLDEGTPGFETQLPGTNPFQVPGPGEVPPPEPTG